MSLTVTQQLQLISGVVKPPSNSLMVLVHQTASVKAKMIYDEYKTFDPQTYPLGQSYLNKMLQVSNSVFKKQGDIIEQLSRIIVTIIGSTEYTLAQIQAANDTSWEGFILDQMDEAFEYLGGVLKEEKTEYNSIV